MAKATHMSIVRVFYSVKLEDGSVFDSNMGQEPLTFMVGGGEVIPGLDEAVIGMEPNESKTLKIPSDKAYGTYDSAMVKTVDRNQFPENWTPTVGEQYHLPDESGSITLFKVTQVSEKELTLDYNHPLADKELTVEVTLLDVQ